MLGFSQTVGASPAASHTNHQKMLVAEEVAEILRIPVGRVYELVRRMQLPAIRVGRLVRIPEGALEDWIARGGVPVGSEMEAPPPTDLTSAKDS